MIKDSDYVDKIDTIVNFNHNILKDLYSKNWYTNLVYEKIDMYHTVGCIGKYSRRPVISEAIFQKTR